MPEQDLIPLPDLMPFLTVCVIHDEDGYIVWRRGTGENVELLHIKSARSGGGSALLIKMLEKLKENPPYSTVFGFTRTGNTKAIAFYWRMGFTCSPVAGVYAEGSAMVFSAQYVDLCKRHGAVL